MSRKNCNVYENETIFIDYYNQLKELALNVFKWENLPTSINERFLELCLYERGGVGFFKDEILGELALPFTIQGRLDIYNDPQKIRVFANNGYNATLNKYQNCIIYNNFLKTPTDLTIRQFALKLYECEASMIVNIRSQKTPLIILTTEQQKLSMERLTEKITGNEPLIFGDKSMDIESVKVLNTNSPFICNDLHSMKNKIWNDALTFLGIENSTQDKKERLVSDEVGSNYGNIEAQRNVMLNARKIACKKINEMFGLDIDVKFRSELQTMVNSPNIEYNEEMEVEEIE